MLKIEKLGNRCTGCMACIDTCLRQCVKEKYNKYGEAKVKIDYKNCVSCGQCEKNCVMVSPINIYKEPYECYAYWNKSYSIYRKSSSGGFCASLYKKALEDGWVPYGVRYSDELKPIYDSCGSVDRIIDFQTSKYVFADASGVYKKVKNDLKNGNKVLFVGLPCIVHALYGYLEEPLWKKLYTIDLICSGVPSYKDFLSYLNWLRKEYEISEIDDVTFRGKRELKFSAIKDSIAFYSRELEDDYFWWAYQHGVNLEHKCNFCIYRKKKRVGDCTVGDFWTLKRTAATHPFGVNLILINSKKGKELLDMNRDNSHVEQRSIEEALESSNFKHENKCNYYNNIYHFLYKQGYSVKLIKMLYDIDKIMKGLNGE